MWAKLMNLLAPFSVIAKELTTIRELYELDLNSREKPVFRVTEQPGRNDTQVFYDLDDSKPKTRLQRMYEGLGEEDDED